MFLFLVFSLGVDLASQLSLARILLSSAAGEAAEHSESDSAEELRLECTRHCRRPTLQEPHRVGRPHQRLHQPDAQLLQFHHAPEFLPISAGSQPPLRCWTGNLFLSLSSVKPRTLVGIASGSLNGIQRSKENAPTGHAGPRRTRWG